MHFLALILCLVLSKPVFALLAVHPHESDALIELYKSTKGDLWKARDNWLDGDPCRNHWIGIHCEEVEPGRWSVTRM